MLKSALMRLFGERTVGKAEYILRPGLRDSWGGPLNGQAYRQQIYRDLVQALPLQAIVETGTFRGTTTTFFAESGLPVYTVEASPRYHAYSQLRLRGTPGVHTHLGDSRSFLRHLLQVPSVPKTEVLFYLDAHWEKDLPLREEVDLIFSNWAHAVVLIDDFEVPGTDYQFDDYGPDMALTLEYLRSPMDQLGLSAYFPAAGPEQETGAKRGCVVLCKEAEVQTALDGIETLIKYEGKHASAVPTS